MSAATSDRSVGPTASFRADGARVLVTGGAGLIGRAVVDLLASRGARVTVVDTTESRVPASADAVIVGSVTDDAAVRRALIGIDAVVHLAGIAGLDHGSAIDIYRANALGTFTVLDAAGSVGIRRIVYASSINANGLPLNPGGVLPAHYPWGEEEAPRIADAYSLSKQANEAAAGMVRDRYGAQVTGLRYPLVRDITVDEGRVFGAHVRAVVRDDPRRAACEGWSYLDVSDAAVATLAALEVDVPPSSGILVAAPTTFLSTPTDRALELSVPAVPRDHVSGRTVPLDLTRAERLLGFRAAVLLDDIDPAQLVDLEADRG